jgi:PRMT5 oligomerisation domain
MHSTKQLCASASLLFYSSTRQITLRYGTVCFLLQFVFAIIQYTCRFEVTQGSILHGFAGYFSAKLYKDIDISIVPSTFSEVIRYIHVCYTMHT